MVLNFDYFSLVLACLQLLAMELSKIFVLLAWRLLCPRCSGTLVLRADGTIHRLTSCLPFRRVRFFFFFTKKPRNGSNRGS